LSKGIIPIYYSQYDINDYDKIKNIHRVSKNNILNNIEQIVLIKTLEKDRNEMAYDFWFNYGPEYCMAHMQTIYDGILCE
jgi:hypothetical protein